jgi:hypothetical protein
MLLSAVSVLGVAQPSSEVRRDLRITLYLIAIGLTPGGNSTHLHTNNTQDTETCRQLCINELYICIHVCLCVRVVFE